MLEQEFDDVLMAARAGAPWAATRLYEHFAPIVTGYLRFQGAVEADDVASETFLQVFRDLAAFEGGESDFRSWVFTIAHHRLIDERRAADRQVVTAPLGQSTQAVARERTDAVAIAAVAEAGLAEALGVLSDPQRDVLLLRVVAGLTVAEASEALDRRPDAVRQLQRRGLRALATAIDDGLEL